MSFFKFTALTIAIDACDVAIIAPRTVGLDTDSTVLMARGQSVLPALTPAEAAAEVDATVGGDPLMAGPYDTLELGDGCYFGGRQVQRIAPTADGLGCIVTFGNVPAVLTVPDVDVDTMTAELNATGECGGGGGGGASYANAIAWGPEVNPFNATAVDVTDDALAFIGDEGSETVGVVTGGLQLTLEATAPGEVSLTTTVPMVPDANIFLRGAAIGPGAIVEARGFITTGGALSISFLAATADPFAVWVLFEYRTGAS